MSNAGRIGVLAESVEQLGELRRLVQGAGFVVTASVEAKNPILKWPDVDIWVVNLDLHKADSLAILETLDGEDKHVIFDNDLHNTQAASADEKPLLPAEIRKKRERRLAQKLQQWVSPEPATTTERKRAQQLWVLAASTGGPEAVSAFISEIPASLKGVAFIYAQHIEASGFDSLLKAVQQNTSWQVCSVNRAYTVMEQTVYVVSPEQQIQLLDAGTIAPLAAPWVGKFKPSLNQVIAKVARAYGAKGGAIVFSGMGDDGADSCTMLHHRGGQVWAQTPATCAVDSMPQSVLVKNCVHQQASPKELGQKFVQHYKNNLAH